MERRRGSLLGLKTYYQSPESILAKLRRIKATMPKERSLKDKDDIRAIVTHTRVNRRRIVVVAKKETTLRVLQVILGTF